MGTWLNSDSLYVKYGTDEGISPNSAGATLEGSGRETIEIVLDLTTLTETETIQNDVCVIPDDSLIESIEVVTLVAAATGTAIDVGTVHTSRNTSDSEYTADPDSLLAAFITATMSEVGEYTFMSAVAASAVPAGTTTKGTLIGEVTTAPLLITASRTDSTAFTAGRILIRLKVLPNALTGFGA